MLQEYNMVKIYSMIVHSPSHQGRECDACLTPMSGSDSDRAVGQTDPIVVMFSSSHSAEGDGVFQFEC